MLRVLRRPLLLSTTPLADTLVTRRLLPTSIHTATPLAMTAPPPKTMRALVLEKEGSTAHLCLQRDVPTPQLGPGQALVKVNAVGLNTSDAAGVMGWLKHISKTPRIPGRDVTGVVQDIHLGNDGGTSGNNTNSDHRTITKGTEVWLTGGHVGFSRDGALAEYIAVPFESLAKKPAKLSSQQTAALPTPWLCAYMAVHLLANVTPTDRVLVIGATGAIGSAVCQMASAVGAAKIYGTVRSPAAAATADDAQSPRHSHPRLHPDVVPLVLDSSRADAGLAASLRAQVSSDDDAANLASCLDVVIDCAGYEAPLNASLKSLAPGGSSRVVVMATHDPNGMFTIDLRTFYIKAATLRGLSSGMLQGPHVRDILAKIAAGFDDGIYDYRYCSDTEPVPLEDRDAVVAALEALLQRKAAKKFVVCNDC